MSRNDRTKLYLEDLPLESVSKIFNFLENVVKNHLLNIDVFEKEIQKYTLLEQYFICHYGSIYYSKQRINSFLKSRHFNSYENEHKRLVEQNADNFIKGIEGMQKSLLKLAKNHKRKYGDFEKFNLKEGFIEERINFRLPLFFAPESAEEFEKKFVPTLADKSTSKSEFKKEVYKILKDILQPEDIELFYHNAFGYSTNPYPIMLLYIEIKNKGIFKGRMLELWTSYSDYYKYQKSKFEEHYKKYYSELGKQILNKGIKRIVTDSRGLLVNTGEIINLSEHRGKFYPKITYEEELKKFIAEKRLFNLPEITKEDLAKTLFNSFAHIREDYFEKLIENPKFSLEEHIKMVSTSLKRTKN